MISTPSCPPYPAPTLPKSPANLRPEAFEEKHQHELDQWWSSFYQIGSLNMSCSPYPPVLPSLYPPAPLPGPQSTPFFFGSAFLTWTEYNQQIFVVFNQILPVQVVSSFSPPLSPVPLLWLRSSLWSPSLLPGHWTSFKLDISDADTVAILVHVFTIVQVYMP